MSIFEILVISVGVFGTSFAAWSMACFYHSLGSRHPAAVEIFRNGRYRYFTIFRSVLAVMTILVFSLFVITLRNESDPNGFLVLSLVFYFTYGASCAFSAIRAAHKYVTQAVNDA